MLKDDRIVRVECADCYSTLRRPRNPRMVAGKPRFQATVTRGDLKPLEGGFNPGQRPAGCAYVYDRLLDKVIAEYPTEAHRNLEVSLVLVAAHDLADALNK